MLRRERVEACCLVFVVDVAPVFIPVFVPVLDAVCLVFEAPVLLAAAVGAVFPVDVLLIDTLPVGAFAAGAFVPGVFFTPVLGAVLWSVPESVAAKAAQPAGSVITRMAAKVRKDPVYLFCLRACWPCAAFTSVTPMKMAAIANASRGRNASWYSSTPSSTATSGFT